MVYGPDPNFVEIQIEDGERGLYKSSCDCPAFEAYGACKHVVAGLLAIADHSAGEDDKPFGERDYEAASQFLQTIAGVRHQASPSEILPEKQRMHVEYLCRWTFGNLLHVELKTGTKRHYVVREVKDFLENVFEGREHDFTKNFTYHPDSHYFSEADYQALEELYDIHRNGLIYDQPSISYYQDRVQEKRSILVPPYAIRTLLKKLEPLAATIITPSKEYEGFKIEEGPLPFEFSLDRTDNEDLVFKINGLGQATYSDAYGLIFMDGTFYFPEKNQLPIVEEMMHLAKNRQQMPVRKEQADLLLSEVLPSLKQVGNVHISEEIKQEIIDVPLKAKLYLEIQETVIAGRLEYHYGAEVIEPFAGKSGNKLILRDAAKEQHIMRLIEHSNFHFNGKNLYVEADDEALYEFLYRILPQFEAYADVYLTRELQSYMIDYEPEARTDVRVSERLNLLDIGFSVEGVTQDEIEAVLAAVIEKKRFYRMNSGAFLPLGGEGFRSVSDFFRELDLDAADAANGHVSLPMFRGAEVDELIQTKKIYDQSFQQLLDHLRSPERQVYELPETLQAELRSYQETGYQWFKSLSAYHFGGILADDMGLGKTLQSIAYMASEQAELPHLIVAPSSVVYNWKNECEKFAPSLSVAVISGTPQERQARIEEGGKDDIWITSYQTLRQDIELYRELDFQTLILDEAQYIKNYQTKTSKAIREIRAARKFALSGTPIENSIDELWAIFQVIMPGLMPSHRKFKELSHDKIARMTRPFILRRLKKDVLTELPDKIETVLTSDLTQEQKSLYVGYLDQLRAETAASLKTGSFRENRMRILAGLTRLRQICCHPSLFMENYEGSSGKLEELLDLIDTLTASGKRMLIFSQFTSMHEIIARILEEKGIDYFYLHGQTKSKDRVEMCERFNAGENSIFLISLKAGGTGLNLTGADTVILYDLWWNPAVEDQAAGRAHRFGQKNVVQVMRLIAEGTIEEKIYELQQKKRELIDAVIQPGEGMAGGLSEDDVRELLNI